MKNLCVFFLFLVATAFSPLYAIDFWHSNTVFGGQGGCSAEFTFDSFVEEFKNIQVQVTTYDEEGNKVGVGKIEVHKIGDSNAERYATAYLSGPEYCGDLNIVVNKATAIVKNRKIDLIKNKNIRVRVFRPYKIKIYE